MKWLFILTTTDVNLGGIARSVPALALAMARSGVAVQVFACEEPRMTVDLKAHPEWEVTICRDRADLRSALRQATSNPEKDLYLYHAGIWDPLNYFVARLGRRRGIPVIASPRSMLDPWALRYRRWKKRFAWHLYARRGFMGAAAVHATANLEARYVRDAGYRGPVIVVPNGIDFPEAMPARPPSAPNAPKRILFLSRIHPKKGIPDLIEAFSQTAPPDWELVIAGNDDSAHEGACRALAAAQPAARRIHFPGPVSDVDKWALYASADLFVLPSYSENFGIVIGEALAAGVPVITTTATPWDQLPGRQCGWCIPTGAPALASALREACALSTQERQAMGARGAAWVREAFDWPSIGRRFVEAVDRI